MISKGISTIIFDLGGVILDLDYQLTQQAFEELGTGNFQQHYTQAAQSGLFDLYETGKISTNHFVNKLLDLLPKGTTPNKVVQAWNAMIKEFPADNLELLRKLKEDYQLILLSNTNELHIDFLERKLRKHGEHLQLKDFFSHAYYSSELGMRKPHPETFQHICELHQLNVSETLFIDDTAGHIEGAQKCGLKTCHFTTGAYQLNQLFS